MAKFDLEGARKSGYSDTEILEGLAAEQPKFDLNGARAAGYDDTTILNGLAAQDFGKTKIDTLKDAAVQAGKNIVSALTPQQDTKPPAAAGLTAYRAATTTKPAATPYDFAALSGAQPQPPAIEQATAASIIGDNKRPEDKAREAAAAVPVPELTADNGFAKAGKPYEIARDTAAAQAYKQRRMAELRKQVPQASDQTLSNMAESEALSGSPANVGTASASNFDFDTHNQYKDAGTLERGTARGVNALKQQAAGLHQFFGEVLGADGYASAMADTGKKLDNEAAAIGDRSQYLTRNWEGAVSSIVSQTPGLTVATLSGGSIPLLMMGAQTFGDEYQTGRAAGLDPLDATQRAGVHGVAEIIGEKIGMPSFAKVFKDITAGAPTDQLVKDLAKHIAREVLGEQLTTAIQFSNDKFTPYGLNQEAGLEQYLGQAADTLVQTVMQAGAMGSVGVAKSAIQARGEQKATVAADVAKDNALAQWDRTFKPGPREPAINGLTAVPNNAADDAVGRAIEEDALQGQLVREDAAAEARALNLPKGGLTRAAAVAAQTGAIDRAAADQRRAIDAAELIDTEGAPDVGQGRSAEPVGAGDPAGADVARGSAGTEPVGQQPLGGTAAGALAGSGEPAMAAGNALQPDAALATETPEPVIPEPVAPEATAMPDTGTTVPNAGTQPIARVGTTPKSTEDVTVKNGVVHLGKYPAQNFETGDDITVDEPTFEAVSKALRDGGALSSKQRIYGGTAAPIEAKGANPFKRAFETMTAGSMPQGVKDPEQAKSAFDAGLIKSAGDLRRFEENGYPQPKQPKAKTPKPVIPAKTADEFADRSRKHFIKTIKDMGGISVTESKDVTGEPAHIANRMAPGLFRTGGNALDLVARRLNEAGYLSDEHYNDVDGGVQAVRDLVGQALAKEPVIAVQDQERYHELMAQEQRLAEQEHALAEQMPAHDETLAEILADEEGDLPDFGAGTTDTAESMRAMGFTEDEINAQLKKEQGTEAAGGTSAGSPGEGHQTGQDQEATEGGQGQYSGFALQPQTEAELAAADQAAKQKAEDKAKAYATSEAKRKADAERDDFQLTGSDRASDANGKQGDIFSQPDVPNAKPSLSGGKSASWVIRNKATGEVVMETFDKAKVDALNTDKYEAVPIQEHLASLNKPVQKKPITPQVMSSAQFNSFVNIAADSIDKLRKQDVERVLDETPAHFKTDMAGRIKSKRPDLAAEVDAVMAEAVQEKPASTEREPAAKQNESSDQPKQGKIGMKLGSGEVVLTASGRETTPFPKVKTGPLNTSITIKAADKWLMQNALDEANSRGDRYNARMFEAAIDKPQQADKDSAEEYLFGHQPDVVPSILKPLSTSTAKDTDQLDTEYRLNPVEIHEALDRRGDLTALYKAAGVRNADTFGGLPMDERAAAYAKFVQDGGKPVEITEDYNTKVARMEHEAEVRRKQSTREITQANGKPFKTEQSAQKVRDEFDLNITHRIDAKDGGFVLALRPPAHQAEEQRKADGKLSYQEAQDAVVKEMGLGETKDGEVDATDDQWKEIERRTAEILGKQDGRTPDIEHRDSLAYPEGSPEYNSLEARHVELDKKVDALTDDEAVKVGRAIGIKYKRGEDIRAKIKEAHPDDQEKGLAALGQASKPGKPASNLDAAAASIDAELDSALDDLAAALKSQGSQLNSGVDPKILALGVKVGSLYVAKGVVKFAQYARAVLDALHSRGVDPERLKPYLKQFYAATKQEVDDATFDKMDDDRTVRGFDLATLDEKGDEHVTDQRSGTRLEPDRQDAATQDGMGEKDVRAGRAADGGTGGPGVQDAEGEGGAGSGGRISGYETAPFGERGDLEIYTGGTRVSPSTAGGSVDSRGGEPGVDGPPIEPEATDLFGELAESGLSQEVAKIKQRQADKQEHKPGLANIRDTLPILTDGQQEDVHKAETRFAMPDGYGMLFTNGTGTGKTFTGLGVIKRHVTSGNGNILVVAPNDKIIEDWQKSGELLALKINRLADTNDAGSGVVITTYANMGQNDALASRDWDLIVHDEAHYLAMDKDGTNTNALKTLRAISLHPDGAYLRAEMQNRALVDRMKELIDTVTSLGKAMNNSDLMEQQYLAYSHQLDTAEKELKEVRAKWDAAREAVKNDVAARQGEARTRALFLSATPFAYEKTVDWANGYLFDYNDGRASEEGNFRGYNQGSNRDQFFVQHFGYRLRFNKLTEPDAKVDRGLMQRQFNGWLKKTGALSGRMLDVKADYDRRFVLVDSAIGTRIDEALQWFDDKRKARTAAANPGGNQNSLASYKSDPQSEALSALRDIIAEKFDYLSRRYLLEAIKAREVVPHVREHLALGRKVVVFHDYKKGGGFNPFDINPRSAPDSDVDGARTAALNAVIGEFRREFRDLIESDVWNSSSPITAFQREFQDVLLFNGDVPSKQRRANVAKFQDDASGPQVMLVQSAAGKEGISLHDTTGKYQRVLFNLGQPTQPTTAIQQEGRIYRTGQVTDAIFRYLNTGTNWEKWAFATTIAHRASTAENLGMGELARALKDAFIAGFEESGDYRAGMDGEGKGGKERDRAANEAITEYDRARAFYFGTQKKTSKTKAQEGADYFATPEPLGLKMVEWANMRTGEDFLEPSAGHGAIARWAPDDAVKTGIEPSSALRPRLAMVFDGKIVDSTFEDLNIVNKYDAIVMNPPFGSGGRTAIDHVAKAAQHLRDGGRIVALIQTGPAADKKFEKWFYEEEQRALKPLFDHPTLGPIYKGDTVTTRAGWLPKGVVTRRDTAGNIWFKKDANSETMVSPEAWTSVEKTGPRTGTYRPAANLYLAGEIKLPQVTFERAGTAVATRVVVIEKQTDKDLAARIQQANRDLSGETDINDLFNRLENVSLPDRTKPAEDAPTAPVAAPVKPKKEAVDPVAAQAAASDIGLNIIEHTTGKGKVIRGVVRTDLTKDQAKAIDEYTFKKDGGFFIREKNLAKMQGGDTAFSRTEQTDTPEFKKWFGDSKVVDTNGKPLVVYHGTGNDFSAFNSPMIWMSVNPGHASDYAEATGELRGGSPNVIPAYANIRQPFDSDRGSDGGYMTIRQLVDSAIAQAAEQGHAVSDEDANHYRRSMQEVWNSIGLDDSLVDTHHHWSMAGRIGTINLRDMLKSMGFDGISYSENSGFNGDLNLTKTFAAFSPSQVKSAIGNNGEFDADNPGINFNRDSLGFAESAGGFTPILQGELDDVINRVASGWKRAHGLDGRLISSVDRPADLPAAILRAADAQNVPHEEIKGVLHNGHVYLVRENLKDAQDAELTIFHEAFGHLGARLMLGPDAAAVQKAFVALWNRIGALDGVRKMADRFGVLDQVEPYIRSIQTADLPLETKQKIIMDELLAHVAGRGNFTLKEQAKAYLGALRVGLRNAARAMGLNGIAQTLDAYTDNELLWNLKQMRAAVIRGGRGPGGGTLFSRQATIPGVTTPQAPQLTSQPPLGVPPGFAGNQASWDTPENTGFDNLVYKLQDKHIDTKRVIEAVQKTGNALADKWNPYLQEELFHGRSAKRTLDFVDRELNPLLHEAQAAKLSLDDIDQYLHARHAEEANDLIASRDPAMPDGGSGMTTADARAYLAALPADKAHDLAAIAAKVDAIIAKTRQLYADYGLESQDTVNEWGTMFKHYVPLMREDKDGAMGIGQGFSIKGREVKHRTGSTRAVVDILANIAMQREKVIVRGEKNRVAVSLAGLAKLNPNVDFWTFDKVPTERVLNEATGLIEVRPDPMFKSRPNVIVAKIKGRGGKIEERAIVFNDSNERAMRMAESLKNLDVAQLEGVMGVSAKITRYFASINTQYNPVFGFVNLTRDVQGALLNLNTTPLKHRKTAILWPTFTALAGIYLDARAERRGGMASSPWAQLWEEFNHEGGQTGYRDLYATSADRANAIRDALDPTAWMDSKLGKVFTAGGVMKVPLAVAQKQAKWIFDWLSDFNLAMENAVRLSAYKVALEQGMTKQQAASLAKNLTVNFNRKGQSGQQAGALYAFFNASMQGTARIAETLTTMEPGRINTMRLSGTGKAIVVGGMLLGVMQAVLLAAMGYDDDEPPEFVRERNLIIPLGMATGKKNYLTIPMPLGYHVIPNLGRVLTEIAMDGGKDGGKRVFGLFGTVAEAFNPLGGTLSLQTIAPTALDPFVALATNEDWTGKQIARKDFSSMEPTPGFTRTKDTASSYAKALAEAINYATGGTDYTPGAMSPTPDQIDYLVAQITGGVGRELGKLEQTITALGTGEELPTHKIPLLGRYYGSSEGQAGQAGKFYENLKEAKQYNGELKGRRDDGLPVDDYLDANPDADYLAKQGNKADTRIKALRRRKLKLIQEGAPREDIKDIEARITEVMSDFNQDVAEVE